MNNIQYIGAVLTGVAALATAFVTVYNTFTSTEKRQLSHTRVGTVLDKDGWTYMRQLPSTNSFIITKLANGAEVSILNETGNWLQVQTSNNKTGFIFKKNLIEQ